MTIGQILNAPASELEALTDQQIEEYFKPFFNVTRPELAPRMVNGARAVPALDFKMKQGLEKCKELGIDVSHFVNRMKR